MAARRRRAGALAMERDGRIFGWLGSGDPPPRYDLARLGWFRVDLGVSPGQAALPLLIDDIAVCERFVTRRERAPIALLGVEDPILRANLLAQGFGEVLPGDLPLKELDERIGRLAIALDSLPRHRDHGRLRLDLLMRDGRVADRRLNLHPREFALLWRLAETPEQPVAPAALLTDVWQLNFRPETNSLAVHVCRLRAKLAAVGIGSIVRTTPTGSYVLDPDPAGPAIPLANADEQLDAYVRRTSAKEQASERA